MAYHTTRTKATMNTEVVLKKVTKAYTFGVSICAVLGALAFEYRNYDEEQAQKGHDIVVVVEGCEYVAIAKGDGCDTVHIDGCRNPIHWSHVISDTSWYWRLREDGSE